MNLAQLVQFEHWQRPATQPVCWRDGRVIGFAELQHRVRALSASLQTQPTARWLLWCEDSFEFLVGLLALWQAGHCAVLPANAQPETLNHLLPDCAGVLSDVLPGAQSTTVVNADTSPLTANASTTRSASALTLDAQALQLFTSGSTGIPKAVSRTLRQLQAELQALQQQFPLPDATVLATVPHHHIYGLLFRLLWPLASGRAFVSTPEHYPEPLLAQIQAHQPTVLISSPAHLERLPSAIDLSRIAAQCQQVFSSGAPLPRATALRLQHDLGAAPLEVLGSTETGGVAWRQRDRATEQENWQLLPGVAARLNEAGVLEVLSPAAEKQDWCMLGDRAEFCGERQFRLLGRADRVVKIEAKRLSLTELEQQLAGHAYVNEATALVLEGARSVVAVVLRLTPAGEQALHNQGKRAVNEALRAHLALRFERVLLPKRFRYVEQFPRDDRGKLTQQALLALFSDESSSEKTPAETPLSGGERLSRGQP
jgi:acyl-coenzyme A synthetase/AMP-(fatty) acid ligase